MSAKDYLLQNPWNLLRVIQYENRKAQPLQQPVSGSLQRSRHLARRLDLDEADSAMGQQHHTIRHSVHAGGDQLWGDAARRLYRPDKLFFYAFFDHIVRIYFIRNVGCAGRCTPFP